MKEVELAKRLAPKKPTGQVVFGRPAFDILLKKGKVDEDAFDPNELYYANDQGTDSLILLVCLAGKRPAQLPRYAGEVLWAWAEATSGSQPIPKELASKVRDTPLYWLQWLGDDVRRLLRALHRDPTGLTPMHRLYLEWVVGDPSNAESLRAFTIAVKETAKIGWINDTFWDGVTLSRHGEEALDILDPES